MAEGRISQWSGIASLLPTTDRARNYASAKNAPNYADATPHRTHSVRFAHPAESAIASIFTAYGVAWEYEPTTFPLVIGPGGESIQSFTPDFFLPDDRVYIEMTTMRQSLVTRKNRKFRLMRELYPDVNIKLLYRKDVELIVDHFGADLMGWCLDLDQPVYRAEQIRRRAIECARHLAGGNPVPIALIAVDPGACPFRDQIAAGLDSLGRKSIQGEMIRSHSGGSTLRIQDGTETIDTHASVVLVADVVSTGLRLREARARLSAIGCPVADVVTLLNRPGSRLIDVPLAFSCFTVPSEWFVGCRIGGVHRASTTC